MELLVVTPPDYFEGEAELINQFFAEGLRLLHIRKPVSDAVQFRELMKGIHLEYYPLISIHQHYDLAWEFSIQRLHFKDAARKGLLQADIERLRSEGFQLSSSVHELAELTGLSGFDYVFYGPVFNSISKAGYHTALPEGFVLQQHSTRVFAIGGIEANKVQQLEQMNFDGAAVLGSLWHQHIPPLAALRNLLTVIRELNEDND